MKRGRRILLIAAGAIAALTVAALLWPSESEPAYQGKTLSEWLEIYNNPQNLAANNPFFRATAPALLARSGDPHKLDPRRNEAADAVRHIGANALPLLLNWINHETPRLWKIRVATVRQKLPKKFQGGPAVDWWLFGADYDRVTLAQSGFYLLGTNASPAVPELARRMNTRRNNSGGHAIDALKVIGTNGLAPMLTALTNTQAPHRVWIVGALQLPIEALGTNVGPAIEVLAKCVGDKDPEVAFLSVRILGQLTFAPDISAVAFTPAVPSLTSRLADPTPRMRSASAETLGLFGRQAHSAVPALTSLLNDSDRSVIDSATMALRQITLELGY